MKKYLTTILLWASLLLSELHTFWENSTQSANWIWTKNVQMPMQWNVKYLTDELWYILMAVAILFYIPNRVNRASVSAYLVFCVADLFMYFYNYKQEGYGWVYMALLITWLLNYNYGTVNRQRAISPI